MRKLEHREVQLCLLEILKDVDAFCTANNIRYSMAYGTLLGAVRHKGFIPWDDDIDLLMPRPDFERFVATYGKEPGSRYQVLYNTRTDDVDFVNFFAKVQDTRTTSKEGNKARYRFGLNLDIFPVDGKISGTEKQRFDAEKHLCHITHRIRLRYKPLGASPILAVMQAHLHSPEYWFHKSEDLMKQYPFEESEYVGAVGCFFNGTAEVFKREVFENYTELEFEGCRFKAISEWDLFLRQQFDDYMQLPPENKRICHDLSVYLKD